MRIVFSLDPLFWPLVWSSCLLDVLLDLHVLLVGVQIIPSLYGLRGWWSCLLLSGAAFTGSVAPSHIHWSGLGRGLERDPLKVLGACLCRSPFSVLCLTLAILPAWSPFCPPNSETLPGSELLPSLGYGLGTLPRQWADNLRTRLINVHLWRSSVLLCLKTSFIYFVQSNMLVTYFLVV